MSGDLIWTCVRQRAGPLVKECRAIRPRLSSNDTPYERTEKNKILRPPRDSSVWPDAGGPAGAAPRAVRLRGQYLHPDLRPGA